VSSANSGSSSGSDLHKQIGARPLELLAQPAPNVHHVLDHRAPPRLSLVGLREDDAVVSYERARSCSTLAYGSRSTAALTASAPSYTTSRDATQRRPSLMAVHCGRRTSFLSRGFVREQSRLDRLELALGQRALRPQPRDFLELLDEFRR
jgi:hypothetical protein